MSLDILAERLRQLDTEISGVDKIKTDLNQEYSKVERELITLLEEQNLQSFKCEHGAFSIVKRFSVKQPKSPEAWEAFWEHLRSIGAEGALKTVNSQKLNSWYKGEIEAAKARGELGLQVPGLEDPSVSEYISMRKL